LLLAGWGFWLLTTFGWTHNTAGGILVALGLLAAVGLVLVLRSPDPSSRPGSHARPMPLPWRTVLVTEVVFTLAFIAWCLVRARMPRIETAGGEKWMEIAFLRAILRSDTFPPHDPWLSGFAISYYYFGYVIVAMVARLAAVPPSIAFNLSEASSVFGSASNMQYDSCSPRPTLPRSWWSCASPNLSARSMMMVFAVGTSMPLSMIVVHSSRLLRR
jgi:uncharacterized membrane protein